MSLDELKRQLEQAQRNTPTYLDTLPESGPVDLPLDGNEQDGKAVLMVYPEPVDLTLRWEREAVAPEGTHVLSVYRRSREGAKIGHLLVGDDRTGEDSIQQIQQVLTAPHTRIAIVVREEEPGLVGRLLVFVRLKDMPGDFPAAYENDDAEKQPWEESIPETPDLGNSWQASQGSSGYQEDYPDSHQKEGPDEMPKDPRVGLSLGAVIRYQQDRGWPDDFMREAKDLFRHGLAGGLPPIRERVLEELKKPRPDSPDDPDTGGRKR